MADTVSALHDNIAKKGSNSYYYAHANTVKERLVTTLGEEPKCLGAIEASSTGTKTTALKSYQWADEEDEVLVYIPILLDSPPEITLESTETSVKVNAKDNDNVYCFSLTGLYEKISGASTKWGPKNKRILLRLKKAKSGSWWKLLTEDQPYKADD